MECCARTNALFGTVQEVVVNPGQVTKEVSADSFELVEVIPLTSKHTCRDVLLWEVGLQ